MKETERSDVSLFPNRAGKSSVAAHQKAEPQPVPSPGPAASPPLRTSILPFNTPHITIAKRNVAKMCKVSIGG